MKLIETASGMRQWRRALSVRGGRVALVPTMGALHEGHMALVDAAAAAADQVVVSIFVNPTQFGPTEDYDEYPRRLEQDLGILADHSAVTAVFAPSVAEMYPGGRGGSEPVRLVVDQLDEQLCGRFRPGHFDGVVTIVAKLLNLVQPDVAVFGLKDAQQFVIISRMVSDLHFDVELRGVPTVRDHDGLALSSRNAYLKPEERRQAVALGKAIDEAQERIMEGEQRVGVVVSAMLEKLAASPDARVQYAEVVDARSLQRIDELTPGGEVLAAVAVCLGSTRLIDSSFITVPAPVASEFSD